MLETLTEMHYDRPLRLARLGQGVPVILLHGYPENLQLFSRLAKMLADTCEVIAFDWPGMGYSAAWPGGATPEAKAKQLLRLMDAWGLEKAHIVGMDMGAQPGLAFAALYPERTCSLVVMNALIDGGAQTSWEIKLLRRFRFNKLLLERFPGIIFKRAKFTFLRRRRSIDPVVYLDMWHAFRQRKVRDFIVRMCAGYGARLERLPDLYRRIRLPVLVLWASDDKHFPQTQARALQQCIKDARLEILDNAGHWMVWEDAAAVAERIRVFHSGLNN